MTEPRAVPIQWRLAGAFALAFAISVLVVVLSYRATGRFIGSSRAAADAARATLALERLISVIQDAETGQRGFLLTGDARYLDPYHRALERLALQRAALTNEAGSADSAAVRRISSLAERKQRELDESVEAYRTGGAAAALLIVRSDRGRALMDSIRSEGRALEQQLDARYVAGAGLSQTQARDAQGTITLLSVLTVLLLGGAFLALRRHVIGQAAAAEALRAERGQLEARIVERTAALNEQMTRTQSALAQAERAALDARVSEQQAALALEQARVSMGALAGSEARFRELADAMPQVVWTARADGYLDYFNQRWYEFTGAQPGRGGDASWLPYLHPDDVGACLERWYQAVRTGTPFEIEYRFRDAATAVFRWHLARALPVRDAAGTIVRWYGTATDIDDQKRAADILRAAQESRRLAIDAGGLGTWTWGGTAGELGCDSRCRTIFGLPADGNVGWETFRTAIHPDDRDRVEAAMLQALEGAGDQADYEVEYRVVAPDGSTRWIAAKGRAYEEAGEGRRHLHGVAMDISDRKRVEERLRQVERMGRWAGSPAAWPTR